MLVCLGTCIYKFCDMEGHGMDLCVFDAQFLRRSSWFDILDDIYVSCSSCLYVLELVSVSF